VKPKILIVLAVGLLAVSAAPGQDDAEKLRKALEGSWDIVAVEFDGQKVPDAAVKDNPVRLVFKGNKYTEKKGGEAFEDGTYQIDPSKKPATLDFTILSGPDKGKTQLAIIELKGDTCKVCLARAGEKERPTAFATKESSTHTSIVLKRVKSEK
jgi:uncharacterized protein (TIGR03067 family)